MLGQIHIDEIKLPRGATNLADVHDALVELVDDETERRVMFAVATDLLVNSDASTPDEAVELLERATPEQRRQLLDRNLEKAGLPSVGGQDWQNTHSRAVGIGPDRGPNGECEAICAAKDCLNFLPDPHGGRLIGLVNQTRWYCDAHVDLYEPGDTEPPQPRYALNPAGLIVDLHEQERERKRGEIEVERRRKAREDHEAATLADIEALRPYREAHREAEARLYRQANPWAA